MSYLNDKFKKARLDQSPYLFHFINGRDASPWETLQKILEEQQLISLRGYVCFSASPLTAIKKFFETPTSRNGKPLYQPWGLGFNRDLLVRDFNARNVIYTDGSENIPEQLNWRTDLLNVDSYDFEYLREWRIKGSVFDFSKFPLSEILVIAPNLNALNHVIVKFDMQFKPYVNYYTGDIEEDWEESFIREWKGFSIDQLDIVFPSDYEVSKRATNQVLGENMDKMLF